MIVVVPPHAAARVPVSNVSEANTANRQRTSSDTLLASIDDKELAKQRAAIATKVDAALAAAPADELVGVAYAIWSGLGVVLIALVGWLAFGQRLDLPALAGMALIVAGVLVMNLFSRAGVH